MAQAFNLGATLQIQGITGIQSALNQVKAAFSNSTIDINVRVAPASLRNLDDLNARILTLRNNLVTIQSSVGAATTSIGNFGQGIGSGGGGISRFSSSVNAAQNTVANMRKEIELGSTAIEHFGSNTGLATRRFVAFSIGAGSVIALIQGLRSGVGAALAFQQSMVKLAQVSGETPDKLRDIQNEVTRLSTSLGTASSELINVAVTLKQAGLTAVQTKQALAAIAETSLAPNFGSMNEIVEGSIAIFRQFDSNVDNLRGHLGALNAVAAEFAVEGRDLVEVIRRAGGAFAQTGGSLNELTALFTSVRSATRESAESISTGLRTIFTRIQRPETVESLRELGVQLRFTADEARNLGQTNLTDQFVGAYEAIRRISEGLASIRPTDSRFSAIIEELGGYRQISRVVPLIQQFTEAQRALNVAQAGSVSLQASTERAQESLINRTTQVKEQFLELFRVVGDSSGFQTFTRSILSLATGLSKVLEFAAPLLPVLTALAAVKLVQGFTQFSGRFASTAFYGTPQIIKRASGGIIPGNGHGDTVPAMLTPGEFVIRKEAAQRYGYDRLATINARGYANGGKVQKFENGGTVFKLDNPAVIPYETIIRSELQNKLGITFKEAFVDINRITDKSLRALVHQIEAVVLPDKSGKQQFAGLNLGPLAQAYNVARTIKQDDAKENRDIVSELQQKEKPKKGRVRADTEIKVVNDFTSKYQNNQSAPEYQEFLKNYQLPIKKFEAFSGNYIKNGGGDLESKGVSSFTAQAAFVKAIERQSASGKGFEDFKPGRFIYKALEDAARDVSTKQKYVESEKPDDFIGPGRKRQVKVTKDKIFSTDLESEGGGSFGNEIGNDARRRGGQGSGFIPYGNFAGDKSGQATINSARKIAGVTNGGLDVVLPKIIAQAVANDEKQLDEGIKSIQDARSKNELPPPVLKAPTKSPTSRLFDKIRAKKELFKEQIYAGVSYDEALAAISPTPTALPTQPIPASVITSPVRGPAGYDPGQRPFGILPPSSVLRQRITPEEIRRQTEERKKQRQQAVPVEPVPPAAPIAPIISPAQNPGYNIYTTPGVYQKPDAATARRNRERKVVVPGSRTFIGPVLSTSEEFNVAKKQFGDKIFSEERAKGNKAGFAAKVAAEEQQNFSLASKIQPPIVLPPGANLGDNDKTYPLSKIYSPLFNKGSLSPSDIYSTLQQQKRLLSSVVSGAASPQIPLKEISLSSPFPLRPNLASAQQVSPFGPLGGFDRNQINFPNRLPETFPPLAPIVTTSNVYNRGKTKPFDFIPIESLTSVPAQPAGSGRNAPADTDEDHLGQTRRRKQLNKISDAQIKGSHPFAPEPYVPGTLSAAFAESDKRQAEELRISKIKDPIARANAEESFKITYGFTAPSAAPSASPPVSKTKSKKITARIKKNPNEDILHTAFGSFDANDPVLRKIVNRPLDPDLFSVQTVFDKERIPVGGGYGALGKYNDPALIARIEKLKSVYREPNLGGGYLPGQNAVNTDIGGLNFPNPKKAGGSIKADARFLSLLAKAGLSSGATGLESYPFELNDPKVLKELEQFEKLANDRARKRKQPPLGNAFDVNVSSKPYVPIDLTSSFFARGNPSLTQQRNAGGLPDFANRGAGIGLGKNAQISSPISNVIGENEVLNGVPQLPGLPRLIGGSQRAAEKYRENYKNPFRPDGSRKFQSEQQKDFDEYNRYHSGENFGSKNIFKQTAELITKRIGYDSPETISQYIETVPLQDRQKAALRNLVAQYGPGGNKFIGPTRLIGPPQSLSRQSRIDAQIAAGTTGPDSLRAQRARNKNFIDSLVAPNPSFSSGRAVPLYSLAPGEGQPGSRSLGVTSAFDLDRTAGPSRAAFDKASLVGLSGKEKKAARDAEKKRRRDLIAAEIEKRAKSGVANLPAVDLRDRFPETQGVVNTYADRLYAQSLINRGAAGPTDVGNLNEDLTGKIQNPAFIGRPTIGASPVSETTKAQLRANALATAELRKRREFLSAEKNAILAGNKGKRITGTELSLLAEESYARVQSGKSKLIENKGAILGSEENVALARAASPDAKLGASGGALLTNYLGEKIQGFRDRLATSPNRFARYGGGIIGLGVRGVTGFGDAIARTPGLGYATYAGVSALSDVANRRAGTAENAIASGETGSIGDAFTGQFTRNRAIGSGLQGALVGGVVGSAAGAFALGGVAGSAAGPIGTVIGAVVGAGFAIANSLQETAKEITEAKLSTALTNLSDQIQILARPGGQGSDPGVGAAALANIRNVRTEQNNRVEQSLTSYFGLSSGRLSSSNASNYFSALRLNQRRDQAGQLPGYIQSLNNIAEQTGRTGTNRTVDDLVADFQRGGGGLNQELLRLVSELRGVSVQSALNDFKKVIEQARRAEEIRLGQRRAELGEAGGANTFSRLASSFQNASESLGDLRTSANALSDLFSNSGGARVSLGGSALAPGALPAETARVLQTIATVGGEGGARLQRVGGAASEIESVLPSILNEISRSTQGQSEEAFGTALRSSLTRLFGGSDAVRARPEIGQGINTVVSQANILNRNGELQHQIEVDVSNLVRRLIDPFASAGRESSQRITALLEAQANSFIDGLANLTARTNQIGEIRDRATGVGVSLARATAEFEGQRTGNERTAISSLPLSTLNAEFISRQERLVTAGARTRNPLNANSTPEEIGRVLQSVQNQIPGAALEQERAIREDPSSPAAQAAATNLNNLRDRARNLQAALDNLANASNQNAVIQERLNTIAQDRQSRLSYAERFTTAGTEGRLEQNRGAALFIQAGLNPEAFRQFTPDQQSAAIQAGRSLGNIQAPAFGGQNVQDVTDNLVRILQPNFTGLPASGQEEERALQRTLLQTLDRAQEAMRISATAQQTTVEQIRTILTTQQQQFFASLNANFQRDRLTTLTNRQGTLEQEGLRLNRSGSVDQLRSLVAGRNVAQGGEELSTQDILRAQGLSGEFSRYFQARQVNQNLVNAAGRISTSFFRQPVIGENGEITTPGTNAFAVDAGGQSDVFGNLGGRGRNSLITSNSITGETRFADNSVQDRFTAFLNRPEFNGLDEPQRNLITSRFLQNISSPDNLQNRNIAQIRPNSPEASSFFAREFQRSVREVLLPGGVDRQGNVLDTLASRNFRDLNQSSAAITRGGFNLPTNVNTPEQVRAFLDTLSSFNATTNRIEELPGRIQRINDELEQVANEIFRIQNQFAERFIPIPRPTVNQALEGFGFESQVPFAFGGQARGTDTVPAMLTPGEFVVNRDSAATNSALLQRINQARGPVYLADGGQVTDDFQTVQNIYNRHGGLTRLNLEEILLYGRVLQNTPESRRVAQEALASIQQLARSGEINPSEFDAFIRIFNRNERDAVTDFGPNNPNAPQLPTPREIAFGPPGRGLPNDVIAAIFAEPNGRVDIRNGGFNPFAPARPDTNPLNIVPQRRLQAEPRRQLPQIAGVQQRTIIENTNVDGQLFAQATINPFGASGSYLAGQSAQQFYTNQANQRLAQIEAQRARDEVIVNNAGHLRQGGLDQANPDEIDRVNRRVEAARRRLNRTEFANAGNREALLANQAEQAQRFGQFIQQRNFDVGQASSLVERQLDAQSQNPFAAFGVGRADVSTQATISQGILSDIQRRRDRARFGDFGNDGFGLSSPQVIRRATGGTVPGTGFGDTVPALLTPGEYVLSRRNVQDLGGTGNVSRLANGGSVGNLAQGSGSGVSSELIAAMNTFGSASGNLVTGFEKFSASANELAQALTNFPAKLEVNGRQTVEVIFNGAEVFNKIQPELMSMVETKTKEMINKVFKDNLPEVNVNIE